MLICRERLVVEGRGVDAERAADGQRPEVKGHIASFEHNMLIVTLLMVIQVPANTMRSNMYLST